MSEKLKDFLHNLKGDAIGGITSGIIAIPLALAFGVASGVGALSGLYGAIFLCLIAAICGGAAVQISGPTGPMTVVIAATIAMSAKNAESIFTIIILAGAFQLILALTKLARVVKYVPYPVISGFMSGIGVIIIILQSNPIIGAKVIGSSIKTLLNYPEAIQQVNHHSIILGIITLLIVFLIPQKINRIIPSALIALVFGTILSVSLGFNVNRIGEIPAALPNLIIPTLGLEDFIEFMPIALTLAIIGAVDSLLTALVVDSVTKTNHDPDRVLIGQGLGNAIAGLFGGVIGAGATMRTVANIKAGGKTRFSAIIHAVFLTILVLGAAPLVKNVPMAVLAGILIKIAWDIIDFKLLKVIRYAPRHDLYVMAVVFLLTVFYDLIFAVGAGITLSALLFAKRMANQTTIHVKEVSDKEIKKLESEIEHDSHHKIRIVHVEGQFFFGSVTQLISRVDDLLGTNYLILNCESIPVMDISAIFALEDIITKLQDQHIVVMIIIKDEEVIAQLKAMGITDQIGVNNIFDNELAAIEKAKALLKEKIHREKLLNWFLFLNKYREIEKTEE